MSNSNKPSRATVRRETALFAAFLAVGVVLLPILIFMVGKAVFGAYEGDGFGGFYATLGSKLGSGDWVAWFLVLSPYLGVQCLRLAARLWRVAGNNTADR